MNRDRGQATSHPVAVLLVVIAAVLVYLVGEIRVKMGAELAATGPGEIELVCAGMFGCNYPPLWQMLAGIGMAVAIIVLLTLRVRLWDVEELDE